MIALLAALVLHASPESMYSCTDLVLVEKIARARLAEDTAALATWEGPRGKEWDLLEKDFLKMVVVLDEVDTMRRKQHCP